MDDVENDPNTAITGRPSRSRRPRPVSSTMSGGREREFTGNGMVNGDMSAAIIGVSFGREVSTVRIGRGGRKSMEGAVAMFAVCFVIGSTMFASVNLREYPVFFGALVATLTELHEPLRLNDNLTIPVFSSIAMQLAFARIAAC